MDKLHLVKIGGNIIEQPVVLSSFLRDFADLKGPKFLVHGGGKEATEFAKKLNIPVEMIDGRRITDQTNLELITMVYAGKLNKSIVAQLQAFSCNALGLSGTDANAYQSKKRAIGEIDYGFVGDLQLVNTAFFMELLSQNIIPICCAVSHDGQGQLLNINADSVASGIAQALASRYDVTLSYCFEKKGVLENIEDELSVIPQINYEKYQELKAKGIIAQGMLPKLQNCFEALDQGVKEIRIGGPELLSKTSFYTKIHK